MQSELNTVDEYLLSVPTERLIVLNKIRELCNKYLVGYHETMFYKMPTYLNNGISEVAFNSQKNYISLYIMKDVLHKYRSELKDCGKGCIRFRKLDEIDFNLVENIIQDVANSSADICR